VFSFLLIPLAQITQYLDPGTGSALLQLLLAALLGIGVTVRVFWRKIKALFGSTSSEKVEPDEGQDDE